MKKIWYSRVLHTASKPFFSALELVLSGNLRVGTLPLYNKKGRFGRFNTGPLVRLIRQDFVQVYDSGVRPLLWWSFTILRGSGGKLIFVMPWSTIFWCPCIVMCWKTVLWIVIEVHSVKPDVKILDCFHVHWQSIEENKSLIIWLNHLNSIWWLVLTSLSSLSDVASHFSALRLTYSWLP